MQVASTPPEGYQIKNSVEVSTGCFNHHQAEVLMTADDKILAKVFQPQVSNREPCSIMSQPRSHWLFSILTRHGRVREVPCDELVSSQALKSC